MTEHKHDENCEHDHDHDHDHDENVFVVTDAEGVEHEMVMVYTFESGDQAYAVLLDRNEPEADGVIFRVEEENEEAYLVSIEEDDEWNRVVAIYNEIAAKEAEENN
jgi:uncharacterized protein YrzB (UPF0473 family)